MLHEHAAAAKNASDGEFTQLRCLADIGLRSSAIAHDVNNLLQVVVGNLELLALVELDERSRQKLSRATSSLGQCVELLKTGFRGQQPVSDPGCLNVSRFQSEMSEAFTDICGSGICLQVETADDDVVIEVGRSDLENAIVNLLINSRDAMGGYGNIRIGTAVREVLGLDGCWDSRLILSVEDDGPGIPEAIQEAVFDRFFTTKRTGSGIGLANVRDFVESKQGEIVLDSRVGRGTCISMSLPCRRENDVRATNAAVIRVADIVPFHRVLRGASPEAAAAV